MKTRYTFDAESGLLVDRDGNVLGRVVGITIDTAPGGYGGGLSGVASTATEERTTSSKEGLLGEPERPTASQLEAAAIQRCWEHYQALIPSRRQLDAKRKRFIRDALRLVGEDAVKTAFTGLSRSPWHNGENPERKKWLDVRYALKGIGDESDDERIEKAITWAAQHAPNAIAMDGAKVDRYLEDIRYTLSLPHQPEAARAKESWRKLTAAGFKVIKLDRRPWARVER